jgi:hypothetical protein
MTRATKSNHSGQAFLTLFSLLLLVPGLPHQRAAVSRSYSLEEAQRVLKAIETITAGAAGETSAERQVLVTESELNSYIAFRIDTEKEEIMRELRLKIFDKNKIEGKIHIDLRGQKIPSFIRPEMNLYFAAEVLVSDRGVKIDIEKLFLENEPIQLVVLDLIIAISARLNGQPATSINDWYELPFGIKDIKTQKGKAFFYY